MKDEQNTGYPYARLNENEQRLLTSLEQKIRQETGRELVLVAHQKETV